jgi:hypothetical protein
VQRRFTLHNPAFDILLWIGSSVSLDEVDAFNDHSIPVWDHSQHPTTLSTIFAADHDDRVVLSNRCLQP